MQNEDESLCLLDFKKALERKVKGVGLVLLHYHWLQRWFLMDQSRLLYLHRAQESNNRFSPQRACVRFVNIRTENMVLQRVV